MSDEKAEAPPTRRRKYSAWFALRLSGLDHEIEAIRRYIDTVTSSIEQEFKSYNERLRVQADGADEETMQLIGEDYSEEASYFVEQFPDFALQNTFVATYSLLEDELLDIARFVGRRLGIKLDPNDLSDTGIHAGKKYLEALCGIAFPEGQHPWQETLHYNRLRNVCAHARGRVKKGDKNVRTYVASRKFIVIDDKDRLHLTKEFCMEVLDNVRELLAEILKLARDRVA